MRGLELMQQASARAAPSTGWRSCARTVCRAPRSSRALELFEHPQRLACELVVHGDDPQPGPMRQVRIAERFEATPSASRRPAPLLGAHSEEVLCELGLPPGELASLRRDGCIARARLAHRSGHAF